MYTCAQALGHKSIFFMLLKQPIVNFIFNRFTGIFVSNLNILSIMTKTLSLYSHAQLCRSGFSVEFVLVKRWGTT